MASNLDLLNKCKRYILNDISDRRLNSLIQDALITSCREIADLGGAQPLTWLKDTYDEFQTKYHATISAITAASPGVITAETNDPNNSSTTGFANGDIVYIEGVHGDDDDFELNKRLFRYVYVSDTTFTLKALNGNDAINTTSYQTYDSGGYVYHAGLVLGTTAIESDGATADYAWDIKRIFGARFDTKPAYPITKEQAENEGMNRPGSRPKRFRYQRFSYSNFQAGTVEHLLFWYPYCAQKYQLSIDIEKLYPDISSFTAAKYPPHPPEIHDCIWHRALALLSTTSSERAQRKGVTKEGAEYMNTRIEVLNANYWIQRSAQEEAKILDYSRKLDGDQAYITQGMGA